MDRGRTIGQSAQHRVFRILVGIAAIALLGVAFLLGRQYQASDTRSPVGSQLGLRDYQQMATYNHYSIVRAYGPSMQPTLAMYNFLLVRDTQRIARGQILVSDHHGIHRVVGLPGETVRLSGTGIQVCGPGGAPCRFLAQPWRHIPAVAPSAATSVHLDHAYATLPDNRQCCDYIIVVPQSDVVGVVAGSLLSYGPTAPDGTRTKPGETTLVYER